MKIKFDFEGRDEDAAIFALVAGLEMYRSLKAKQAKALDDGSMSVAGLEASMMLMDIKAKYPKQFSECIEEYKEARIADNIQLIK